MARLIDTSVLITLDRRGQTLDAMLTAWPSEDVAVAAVTVSELLVGVYLAAPGRKQEQRRKFTQDVIERMTVLPFDVQAAIFHAHLVARLQDLGRPIGLNDTLIAAVALANGYAVVTDNLKHFSRIQGLVVERPPWPE